MRNVVTAILAKIREMTPSRRGLLFFLALFAGLMLITRIARPPVGQNFHANSASNQGAVTSSGPVDTDLKVEWQGMKETTRITPAPTVPSAGGNFGAASEGSSYGTPLISHAAELAVATKEFSRSRSTLEDILEKHHGYASKLRMVGQPGGSLLTTTLRVPSSEFNSVVIDLKTLGTVEHEEQTADEITQQHADLEARLTNAQNRLQHLQAILAKVDKWGAPPDIQRQIAAVGAEIARLEAERVASEHRVTFSNVLFSLKEEITPPVEGFGVQVRRAVFTGLTDALSSLSAIALFVMSYGPTTLIWLALVFFPGRWIWRKLRPAPVSVASQAPQSV
jgi:hypothetical protein